MARCKVPYSLKYFKAKIFDNNHHKLAWNAKCDKNQANFYIILLPSKSLDLYSHFFSHSVDVRIPQLSLKFAVQCSKSAVMISSRDALLEQAPPV